jgi:transcriptional regulator EpsA
MDNPDIANLPQRDLESLLYAIDGSLKVHRRFQFFLWSQGGLQGPLPHETLVCAWGGIDNTRFKYEVFSRAVLDDRFTKELANPVDGLLPRLIAEWLSKNRQPCVYVAGENESNCPPALSAEFRRQGLQRVVAHGTREMRGDTGSFFVFINGASHGGPHDRYFVEMMMPHLHMTLQRVADSDDDESYVDEVATDNILSDREIQVLNWVRGGKTNQEIALILDISPLTVKNHMQKVLRKLKVSNRAQAVAKGISARILTDSEAS